MKTYNSPMLQVVGINTKDIIATSRFTPNSSQTITDPNSILAPGQRSVYEDWYEGY